MMRLAIMLVLALATRARADFSTNAWGATWHDAQCASDLYHALDERASVVGDTAWHLGVTDPLGTNLLEGLDWATWHDWGVESVSVTQAVVTPPATQWVWSVTWSTNAVAGTNWYATTATARCDFATRYVALTNVTTNITSVLASNWHWQVVATQAGGTNIGGLVTNVLEGAVATERAGWVAISNTTGRSQWHAAGWLAAFDAALAELCESFAAIDDLPEEGDLGYPTNYTYRTLCEAALGEVRPARTWGRYERRIAFDASVITPEDVQVYFVSRDLHTVDAATLANDGGAVTSYVWVADIDPRLTVGYMVPSGTVWTVAVDRCWTDYATNLVARYSTQTWHDVDDDRCNTGSGWSTTYGTWALYVTNVAAFGLGPTSATYGTYLTNTWVVHTNDCGSCPTVWHARSNLTERARLVTHLRYTISDYGWTNGYAWEKRWTDMGTGVYDYVEYTTTVAYALQRAPRGLSYSAYYTIGGETYEPVHYYGEWAYTVLSPPVPTGATAKTVAWYWSIAPCPDLSIVLTPPLRMGDSGEEYCLYWYDARTNCMCDATNEGSSITWANGQQVPTDAPVRLKWSTLDVSNNVPSQVGVDVDVQSEDWCCQFVADLYNGQDGVGPQLGYRYDTDPHFKAALAGPSQTYTNGGAQEVRIDGQGGGWVSMPAHVVRGYPPDTVRPWADFMTGYVIGGPYRCVVDWAYEYKADTAASLGD